MHKRHLGVPLVTGAKWTRVKKNFYVQKRTAAVLYVHISTDKSHNYFTLDSLTYVGTKLNKQVHAVRAHVQSIFCGHCYFSLHGPVVVNVKLNGTVLCVSFQVVYITVEDLHKVQIN